MPFVTVSDGTEIFYKDWGSGRPVMFHHGWPLSSDDWDVQLLFLVARGYRVIAHDRRGHGRSAQVGHGHDMDHYAADAAAVVAHLDLRDVVHVGHSTGGGEVARYVARHGAGRVAKAVLIGAVPPLMVRTESNPGGLPIEVFDGFRDAVATDRSQFYLDIASGPFYGFNRPGADVSQGVVWNWWRQGMAGGAEAHYKGIKAFSETDFTDDLRAIVDAEIDDVSSWYRETSIAERQENVDFLVERGVELHEIDRAEWAEASSEVLDHVDPQVVEWAERIRSGDA